MANKRIPLGLSTEQHQEMALALNKLQRHLRCDVPDRGRHGLARLRITAHLYKLLVELDIFYCLDCGARQGELVPVMYGGPDSTEAMDGYDTWDTRGDLEDIRLRLIRNETAAKALKYLDSIIAEINRAALP